MAKKGICVLGGCGAMGRVIVECLRHEDSSVPISVADRRKPEPGVLPKGVRFEKVDLLRSGSLVRILRKYRVVINSTSHHFNLPVMEAALAARVHYVDLGGLFHFTRRQLKWGSVFRKAGLTAIIGMGCAPGISNLLAKWGSEDCETVDEIHIKVGSRSWSSNEEEIPYAIGTIREEITLKPAVFRKGHWKFQRPISGVEEYPFPSPVGKQRIFNTIHSEVATLPLSFVGTQESSFKIGFSDKLIEKILRPQKNSKQQVSRQNTPSKQHIKVRDCEVTLALIRGVSKGRRLTRIATCKVMSKGSRSAGDLDTAWPPALVALMTYSGAIKDRGVYPPERIVPWKPLFEKLRRRDFRFNRRSISMVSKS
jgi:saccharopine dehydrogenase-like NADP-dependent oxidoreductase